MKTIKKLLIMLLIIVCVSPCIPTGNVQAAARKTLNEKSKMVKKTGKYTLHVKSREVVTEFCAPKDGYYKFKLSWLRSSKDGKSEILSFGQFLKIYVYDKKNGYITYRYSTSNDAKRYSGMMLISEPVKKKKDAITFYMKLKKGERIALETDNVTLRVIQEAYSDLDISKVKESAVKNVNIASEQYCWDASDPLIPYTPNAITGTKDVNKAPALKIGTNTVIVKKNISDKEEKLEPLCVKFKAPESGDYAFELYGISEKGRRGDRSNAAVGTVVRELVEGGKLQPLKLELKDESSENIKLGSVKMCESINLESKDQFVMYMPKGTTIYFTMVATVRDSDYAQESIRITQW